MVDKAVIKSYRQPRQGDENANVVAIPLTVEAVEVAATLLLEAGVLGDYIQVRPAHRLAVLDLLGKFAPVETEPTVAAAVSSLRERLLRTY